ncbi:MAG: efflux transporter outer membrane subunit [Dokdonella sp.]|uniref:efflux transporter outer membrane subunit n=1 Tax=Dokdonella sp. TaxID=2291710 RepID=UPI0032678399
MTAIVPRPLVAVALVVIAGCSIPRKPDMPQLRNEAPLAGVPTPANGAWPDARWWQRYGDPQLDRLEEQGTSGSPSIEQARQRFNTAVRSIDVASAAGGASIQANGQVQRLRLSENGLIPPQFLGFTWYNQGDLSLQFQYDFDFWGKTRAAVAAAIDEAHAAEAERSAAALMLTTAIADTYFSWQADQARLALANDTVSAYERQRAITARRAASGIDAPDYVHQADAQLAGAREQQAALAGSSQLRLAALAALLGVSPADLPKLDPKPLPTISATLPEGIGIDLLARRPDIAANRWRIEAAMRRVDAARAEFYPDISLGAMIGLQSLDLGKLVSGPSRTAALGPAVHLPLFGLGRQRAAYGVSQAQLDSAAAQYDASVVDAAREVATQALTLAQIDARRHQREQQLASAQSLVDIAVARARRGVGDDRSVLAAQAQVLQQRDAAATLDAQAVSADIALNKALGGGYRMDDMPVSSGTDASAPLPHSVERAHSR